jgi:CHAT domain-containing protein
VRQAIQTALPTPIGAAEAQRVLPPDTALLAFYIDGDTSTLFVVTRDRPVQAIRLALPEKELAARVDFVRRSVSREAGTRGLKLETSDEVRVSAARDLYRRLFPAEALEALQHAGRILLSPDGVLWDLPFAALVTNDQGKPQYLGLEKPLAYTQSLTTFAQSRRAAPPARRLKDNVLVVGNPLFDNALRGTRPGTAGVTSQTRRRAAGELAMLSGDGIIPEPLPHAEEEAIAVAKTYGVRAATGAIPTEAWFRQHAPDADVVHLATHGYFNPWRAVSSGLWLAVPQKTPESGETNDDGALQAWEVFSQLELRAELVVLSACETGLGSKVPGEGLVGLSRAFQVAGASSIVATHWRVSDRSTATGMLALHQNLRRGLPKDEALRQAMRKLANDPATANPYHWAPFILVGDLRPLPFIRPPSR